MTTASSPGRRPINPQALAPYAAEQKLARPLPPASRRSVSISRDQLVPVVQAEVGAEVPIPVYSYRIFVPIAQVIWESATAFRQLVVATKEDIESLRNLLIQDFGGDHAEAKPLTPPGCWGS